MPQYPPGFIPDDPIEEEPDDYPDLPDGFIPDPVDEIEAQPQDEIRQTGPDTFEVDLTSASQPPSQKNYLREMWEEANKPLVDIRRQTPELYQATEEAAKNIPYIGKGLNFVADMMSSMSSPVNIGTGLATAGAGTASRLGYEGTARALDKVVRGGSAIAGVEGARDFYNAENNAQRAGGLAEMIGGGLGVRYGAGIGPRRTNRFSRTEVEPVNIPNRSYLDQPTLPFSEIEPNNFIPYTKLVQALKKAPGLIDEQGKIYTAEKGQRINSVKDVTTKGVGGYYERLGRLKGDYTKVRNEPLDLTPNDIDQLVDYIQESKIDDQFAKLHATSGLLKVVRGEVPQLSELKTMGRIFGPEIEELATNASNLRVKKPSKAMEIFYLSKSIKASLDMSAPLRQGGAKIVSSEWWRSLDDMVKSWGSQDFYEALQRSIYDDPLYALSQEAGLQVTDMQRLLGREEQFMSTMAENIPSITSAAKRVITKTSELKPSLLSKGIRASNRAYSGFLNKLRFDTFKRMIKDGERAGLNPKENFDLVKAWADHINNATGRGSLKGKIPFTGTKKYNVPAPKVAQLFGKKEIGIRSGHKEMNLESAGSLLNGIFYSPRFISSRLKLYNEVFNPHSYLMADPVLRKERLRSLLSLSSLYMTNLALAKAAGAEVNTDPTSSDFGKGRFGNYRIEATTGLQPYLVLGARLITNTMTANDTSGARVRRRILGEGWGTPTQKDVIEDFLANKTNPPVGMGYRWIDRSKGRPFDVSAEVMDLFTPMIMQDVYEIYQEDPSLFPYAVPAFFGLGTQRF